VPVTARDSAATENLYIAENAGKYYVSLDFTSANFNSLRYYDPKLVFDTKVLPICACRSPPSGPAR
jgi:hypothetical protein